MINSYNYLRIPPGLLEELDARSPTGAKPERGAVIRTDLGRYYALLAAGRNRARRLLTREEVGLVCDVVYGATTRDTPRWASHPLLTLEVDAVSTTQLSATWGVNVPALLDKLRGLDPAALLAVLDAAERYWIARERGEDRQAEEALHG